jgi:16S rRNA (cytidine1402-2'-O)-methyltransferase
MLYIVPTPIWNLEDITYRAVRILWEVDIIACEDTRTSGILLKHYDIKATKTSYHSHSGKTKSDKIIELLKEWKNIALISDAGTPWISDPWYALMQDVLTQWLEVTALPWPSAVITALSASGMSSHHFLYLGFLPVKKWRQTLLTRLSENKTETVVIYESVHHIVIWRELTKKFEEYIRGNINEVIKYFEENPGKIKWEFVVLF